MPPGPARAGLLLRRLSSGSDPRLRASTCAHCALGSPALAACSARLRLSTSLAPNIPQLVRRLSDNIIKMAVSSAECTGPAEPKHTNRLSKEKSPYLLQHAHNPVDWYPWGQEAFTRAKQENKLIFLSVGYSTCHWCHVMETESFEKEDVAKIMNEHYINVKVDREERPDIDKVYMLFVQATTGSGGWPMSVFLTPDLKPVTGGTYFPPEDRWGRPGFKSILLSLARKWRESEQDFLEAGTGIIEALKKASTLEKTEGGDVPGPTEWKKCVQQYLRAYEPEFGGFGVAPKFPQPSNLNFLFHVYARDKTDPQGKQCLDMCLHTLTKMAKGGIHDHISSGFARYSVDAEWHVPHFEKMLYDQAQLAVAYTDAYLATKDPYYEEIVRDIIKYVNRDLSHESGGFYSAEDADSYPTFGAAHKKEGAFCVWEYDEIETLLENKTIKSIKYTDIFCDYFGVEPEGNISHGSDPHGELTNKNVLIIYGSKEETATKFGLTMEEFDTVLSECTEILYAERQKRPRPHLDSKILCSWNGLMISGLAQAGQGLGDKDFVDRAIKAANFIKKHLYIEGTHNLLRSCYLADDGSIAQTEQPIQGFLDDYAFLVKGLLDLYEASLDLGWLTWARELQTRQDQLFWDDADGGYFTSSASDPSVVLRLKEDQDGAEPCGNSVACHNLLRLAAYADKSSAERGGEREREAARRLLVAFSQRLREMSRALPEMVSALMFYVDSPTQVLISGGCEDPRTLELVRVVRSRLLPARVLAVADPADNTHAGMSDILLSRIRPVGDAPTAYVCRRFACSLPVTDVQQLERILDETSIDTDKK